MIRQFTTVWVLARMFTKRYFRDKVAIFFTFVFPLLFLLIFGFIFGSNDGPSFNVAVINKSDSTFSQEFVKKLDEGETFKLDTSATYEEATEELSRSEIDAILELPEGFGELNQQNQPAGTIKVIYDQSDEQLAFTLTAVLQSALDEINGQFVTVETPLKLETQPINTANLTRFDYTLAGIIGFSILSLGIFSMSEGFTGDKKAGALRRMRVAPIRTWQLIVSTAMNRVLVGVISVASLVVLALVAFNFNMRGDYISLALFTIISTICLFGFGMAIAGWAKDGNQAAPLSNLVSFPMMFLSGVFFPVFLMPLWLQNISQFLPLTPVIDGLRMIMTEGKTIFELGPQLMIIGAWTLIIYFIAFKVFRWE